MRFGLHMLMIIAVAWTSCSETRAKDSSSVRDDSEIETKAVVAAVQPASTETGSVGTKTATEEDFLITFPTADINTATPLATWNESPEIKDYDIIVSLDDKCKIPLQAYGDISIHNQQLKPLAEGTYYICVYAIQNKGKLLATKNSPLAFTVDLTPPAAPSIHNVAPNNRVNSSAPTISWDAIADADTYNMSITTDAACTVVVQEYEDLIETNQALTALDDGAYYVCLDARDKAGNITVAANNALPIVVDVTPAQIVNVTSSTPNGAYKVGAVISIALSYDEVVNVDTTGGTPRLLLETGATDRYATYVSGDGSTQLLFEYTVLAGDTSSDLDLNTTANQLDLNGGTIKDLALNDAGRDAPAGAEVGALSVNSAIKIDTTNPTLTQISSANANGSYKLGDEIQISVRFSETVYATDTVDITLRLETGTVDRYATYFAGSGTNTLYFNYQVQVGDLSADLNATLFALAGAATVRDEAGNNTSTALPAGANLVNSKNLIVDGVAPVATSLSASTVDGIYTVGKVLYFAVEFSEPVNVTNLPGAKLEIFTGMTRQANYFSGAGTNVLTFAYTVQANDNTVDVDNTLNPIKLTGGSVIRDGAGNDATTDFAAGIIAGVHAIALDTVEPEINAVTTTSLDETYIAGESISIDVQFSEVVIATNPSSLKLKMETGSNDTEAVYAGGSGTDKFTFTYIVVSGDESSDLDVAGEDALTLNGATIRDAAGNALFNKIPQPSPLSGSANLVVDGVPPGAFTITGPSNPVASGTQTVTFSAAAGVSKYDVVVSSSNDCSTPVGGSPFNDVDAAPAMSLDDGMYYACVTARDSVGNTTLASNQPYAFEVETSSVHVAYSAASPMRMVTARRSGGNTTLSTVETLLGDDTLHTTASIALGSNDAPYVSYASDSAGNANFDLFVGSWNGALFDTELAHSGLESIGAFNSIALDSNNKMFVSHLFVNGDTQRLKVSDDVLGTWAESTVVNLDDEDEMLDSTIAVDGNDKVHVVYSFKNSGVHTLSYVNNVSGWNAPANITNSVCSQYFQASLAFDSADNMHVAYLCTTPWNECRAYHSRYNGAWTHTSLATLSSATCASSSSERTYKPNLVLNSADKAFVTVFDKDAAKLFLYNNASGVFVGTELLSGKGWQAVIARDAFDKLYIAYRASENGGNLEMISNNSGAWVPTVLDNNGDLFHVGDIVIEGIPGRSNR